MMDERELLDRFVTHGSTEAFAELVRRHVDLVYTSARRQVVDPGLAEDVTQAVFLLLWRKAGRVKGAVAGWLLTTTYFACRNAKKVAMRREHHEKRAAEMNPETIQSGERDWEEYAPLLDKAMNGLMRNDRDAVTLRYFSGLTLKDVGITLGISEEAARKRVDRGIQRLRARFVVKDPTLSATMLATQLASRAVEAAPTKLAAGIRSSTLTAGGTRASAIAKGASHAMLWAKIKIAALMLIAVGVVGAVTVVKIADANPSTAAPALLATPEHPAIGPASQPSVAEARAVQLAYWDAVLSESGEQAIRDISEPVASASNIYEAMNCNSADLRQAVAADLAGGGNARVTAHQMLMAQQMPTGELELIGTNGAEGLAFNYDVFTSDTDNFRWILSGGSLRHDDSFKRIGNDQLQIVLDHPDIQLSIAEMKGQKSQGATAARRAAIVFKGTVNVGQAIAFVAHLSAPSGNRYCHLMVWETFAASEQTMSCMRAEKSAAWWCKNGPGTLQKWADAARQWTARATHEPSKVAQPFEFKLSDGKLVRLVALCRPHKAPFCWWDAQGNPVDADNSTIIMSGNPSSGLWALVQVAGPAGENSLESPMGHVTAGAAKSYEQVRCEYINEDAPLEVSVSIGPWKEAARMKRTTSASVGGATYSLKGIASFGSAANPGILGVLVQAGQKDDEECVTAVGTDGKETEPSRITPIVFGRSLSIANGNFNLYGVALNNLDYFRLSVRKRQTVTFSNFATNPIIALPAEADHPM